MKKTNHHTTTGMALGMCLGVSFGTSLGMVFDNTSLGISLGLSIGLALGLALGSLKDKEVNKQLEEKGYYIKSIVENAETDEYAITIADKFGLENIVITPAGQMDEEDFEVGDVVFLDEDGMIEQAYDKEDEQCIGG